MAVRAITACEINPNASTIWECLECWGTFYSMFAAGSDTKPLCPYCRATSLESSHAELLLTLELLVEGADLGGFALRIATEAITRATEEKQ